VPFEGWFGIKDGILKIKDGVDVLFADWLKELTGSSVDEAVARAARHDGRILSYQCITMKHCTEPIPVDRQYVAVSSKPLHLPTQIPPLSHLYPLVVFDTVIIIPPLGFASMAIS